MRLPFLQPHSRDYTALYLADKMLRKHEGFKLFPYTDTLGNITIGVGRNIEAVGLKPDEVELMLSNDLSECLDDMRTMKYWSTLCSKRKAAILDLRFNLGATGFRKFKLMNKALDRHDYSLAATELLDSRYATQVGQRALDLAMILRDG